MSKIHFNGRTYNDIAEMPASEREKYDQLMSVLVDKDGNGIPDIFEGDVVSNIIEVIKKTNSGDSEQIAALEQMPPIVRARLSKGIAKLYELGLISGKPTIPGALQGPSWENAEIRSSTPMIQFPSVIQDDSRPRWLVVVAVVAALGICAAGAAAYVILAQGF